MKVCENCGGKYEKRLHQAYWQHEKSRFCSKICKGKVQGFQRKEQPTKTCELCGLVYKKASNQPMSWWKSSKYCSQSCYRKVPKSAETREKHKEAMLGNKNGLGFVPTKEQRETRSLIWKIKRELGLFKTPQPNPRANRAYREWRKTILERDGYRCLECGVEGRAARLEIDHIKPFRNFPELRFESTNVRTLCRECHKKTETYGVKVFNYGARQ